MPQSHTSDYEPNDSKHGTDHRSQKTTNSNSTKFFATSTREIFERKPLFRSTSLLSSHSRSGSGSISGSGSLLGSSSSTINSSNSNSSSAIYSGPLGSSPSTMEMTQTPKPHPRSRRSSSHKSDNNNVELTRDEPVRPRRISIGASDARFSEYLSSTSSWDCEWEDDDEFPEMKDPVVFPYRPLLGSSSKNSSRSHRDRDDKGQGRSSASSSGYYSELEVTPLVHHVEDCPGKMFPDPLWENDLEQQGQPHPQPSTSRFAAAGILRASCPSLNSMKLPANADFRRKLRDRHADDMSDVSVSTADIGPPKTDEVKGKPGKGNAGKFMNTSKSSGCLTTVNVRGLTMLFLNRPITLRFTPSGLTESHRIVWVSETGNHAGIVKWVGKIRGTLYAGIEFEKPIGNSSGIYGYGHGLQTRLFTCKLGYGRFLPVDQLILYEDFYENQKTGFICIICRDDFIEPGQVDDLDLPEKIMVATKCGHLFHHRCLNQWFNEKSAAFQHCPYCQNPMERNDTIRIFPAQVK